MKYMTLKIPEHLHRAIKAAAATKGQTITDFTITGAVERAKRCGVVIEDGDEQAE